jgi:hypothetical protein
MIFCDLDGVLVDFQKQYLDFFGKDVNLTTKFERWSNINIVENYWINIPKTQDADELIEYLSNYNYKILTGLPKNGYKKAEIEKPKWVKKYIGESIDVICCLAKEKSLFGKPNDILIDDKIKNITQWRDMGGIGILHQNARETIQELKIYGY